MKELFHTLMKNIARSKAKGQSCPCEEIEKIQRINKQALWPVAEPQSPYFALGSEQGHAKANRDENRNERAKIRGFKNTGQL